MNEGRGRKDKTMHIYLRSLDRFFFSGAPGVLHNRRQTNVTFKHMYPAMLQVRQQILREINGRCLSYQINNNIFPCPLITSTSVLVLSI